MNTKTKFGKITAVICLGLLLASCATAMVEGEKWLNSKQGNPEVNISGTWLSSEWGLAKFEQNEREVTGTLGDYPVKGVVSGSSIYLLMWWGNKADYSAELKALDKPIITVLNKIDMLQKDKNLESYLKRYENSVAISALKKTNLQDLSKLIESNLSLSRTIIKKLIPHSEMRLISTIRKQGKIFKEKYGLRGVYIEAEVPAILAAKLKN